MKFSPSAPCPCGSGAPYKSCCRPCHQGVLPPTPEALMRSRYSAYKLGLADYIIDTTHPDGPQFHADRATWKREIEAYCRTTRFEGLRVLSAGGDTVMFHAILFSGTQEVSFREISLFRRHDDRWKYYSGTLLP